MTRRDLVFLFVCFSCVSRQLILNFTIVKMSVLFVCLSCMNGWCVLRYMIMSIYVRTEQDKKADRNTIIIYRIIYGYIIGRTKSMAYIHSVHKTC